MTGRYRYLLVYLLLCLSVLPPALRAQGYHISDRLPYHAASVYYVTLQNADRESINSQYADTEGAIGAFVGGELRGTSQWQPTEGGRGIFVVRVWGGSDDEGTATFRLRDKHGLEYEIGSQPFGRDEEATYGSPAEPVRLTFTPLTGISLPFKELTLKQNQSYSLQTDAARPLLLPADHSTLLSTLKYEYKSSSAAFSVSENGMLTGVTIGQGTLTVKATPGNFTAEATVKVEAGELRIPVTEIRNNMPSNTIEMLEGDQLQLDYTVLPDDATNKAVTFRNNYAIVDIMQDTETSPATIVAKKAGKDTLTVISADNAQATLTYYITVKKVRVTKIEVSPATINAYVGETYDFTLKVLPDKAENKEVEATVADTSIAGIDMDKKQITAKAIGTTKIVFRSKDVPTVEAAITVKVSAVPVVTLKFAAEQLTASKLRDVQLTLTKEGTADFLPSRVELVFSTAANGEPVATATKADDSGLKWTVRGQYAGKHTVKVKYNGKEQSSTCAINIPAEYPIQQGWGWMSFYAIGNNGVFPLKSNDKWLSMMTIDDNNFIADIRTQQHVLHYDSQYGYMGDLEELRAGEGSFKVRAEYDDANKDKMVINAGYDNLLMGSSLSNPQVKKGYTWVNYPHELDHTLDVLSEYLAKTAEEGDMIIGRDGFAEFDGEQWIESTDFKMEAGCGYIYYTESSTTRSVNWGPQSLKPDDESVPAASRKANGYAWQYDPTRYPDCMPVVARLEGTDHPEDYTVGAFVGSECRGMSEATANGLTLIAVSGQPGDRVSFQLCHKPTQTITSIETVSLPFAGHAGSLRSPLTLQTDITAIHPATAGQEAGHSEIHDMLGRRVTPSAIDSRKGLYIITVTEGGHRVTRKIISK